MSDTSRKPVVDEHAASASDLDARARSYIEAGERNHAVELIIKEHGPGLLRFLARVTGNQADAADAFSDVCLAVLEHIGEFRWESSLRSWLYAIARNAYRSRLAGPLQKRRAPDSAAALEEIEAVVRTTTLSYLRTPFKDAFARMRQQLDPDDLALLHLRFDCGLPWREVARTMLGPEEVTEDELNRKTASLRKEFERLKKHVQSLAAREGLLKSDTPA